MLSPSKSFLTILAAALILICCNGQATTNGQQAPGKNNERGQTAERIGGPCETCELINIDKPKVVNAVDTSAAWNGEGQKLVVTGTVYKEDRKTPASDIILYYWQTNSKGVYADKEGLDPEARRHGYLRGWVKTDKQGRYTIYTIRPASYPNSDAPAHIHMLVKEPNLPNEYYIDDILFEDDPLLTNQVRKELDEKGGSGVVKVKEENGVQKVNRNIILGQNITNYPEQK